MLAPLQVLLVILEACAYELGLVAKKEVLFRFAVG